MPTHGILFELSGCSVPGEIWLFPPHVSRSSTSVQHGRCFLQNCSLISG